MYYKHTLFLIVCCLGLFLAPLRMHAQSNGLKFKGMYQSQKMGFVNDSYYFLKFFPDGTVLRTYGDLTKESVATVKARMTKTHAITMSQSVKSATYRKSGNQVNFSFGSGNSGPIISVNIIHSGTISTFCGGSVGCIRYYCLGIYYERSKRVF